MTKRAGYDPKVVKPAPKKSAKPNTGGTKKGGLKVDARATALGVVVKTEGDAFTDAASTVSAPKAPSAQGDHRPEGPAATR